METGKGSSPRGENPRKQGTRASREAKCDEGESLTDGPVVAMKRGNARRAKGPCRRHSEREARQERDDKAHHQSAGASSEDRPSGEIRPFAGDSAGSGGVANWSTGNGASFETTASSTRERKRAPAERKHNPDVMTPPRRAGCGKSACPVRGGGGRRRSDGEPYTGTKPETADTAKGQTCTPPRRPPTRPRPQVLFIRTAHARRRCRAGSSGPRRSCARGGLRLRGAVGVVAGAFATADGTNRGRARRR